MRLLPSLSRARELFHGLVASEQETAELNDSWWPNDVCKVGERGTWLDTPNDASDGVMTQRRSAHASRQG